MRLFHRNRAKVCGPEMLFEELEERIVMDASVDPATGVDDVFGHVTAHQVITSDHADTPANAVAAPRGSGDWNLEYSSDPSVAMEHVLNDHILTDVNGELGVPAPSITVNIVPPVTGIQTVVDLSGTVRINGDPTKEMHMVVTYNPRPDTSAGIASLSFKETTVLGVTIDEPGTGVLSSSWHIDGKVDSLNALLSTMQATLVSGFNGMAEIDVSLTDEDHLVTTNDAPLVDRTVYVPVSRAPFTPQITMPNPEVIPTGVVTPIPIPGDPNVLFVQDTDSHELGVVVRVDHGRLFVPQQPPGTMIPSITYFGTESATGTPLQNGPLVGIRGQLPDLQAALAGLQYQSFPNYRGPDTLTVFATDAGFRPVITGLTATSVTQLLIV
jgi:hypothetical protein